MFGVTKKAYNVFSQRLPRIQLSSFFIVCQFVKYLFLFSLIYTLPTDAEAQVTCWQKSKGSSPLLF